MSKNPIKVMSSMLTGRIYAGRVNPKNQMFIGEKDDVTDTAVSAVAQHLLKEEMCLQFEVAGKIYRLEVSEIQEQQDQIAELKKELKEWKSKSLAARVLCETAGALLDGYAHQDAMVILDDLEEALRGASD